MDEVQVQKRKVAITVYTAGLDKCSYICPWGNKAECKLFEESIDPMIEKGYVPLGTRCQACKEAEVASQLPGIIIHKEGFSYPEVYVPPDTTGTITFKVPEEPKNIADGYNSLRHILDEALGRASKGKGKERHNPTGDAPFEEQDIIRINTTHRGFCLGQAIKKINETHNLPTEHEKRLELLDAIIYIAAEIITQDKISHIFWYSAPNKQEIGGE